MGWQCMTVGVEWGKGRALTWRAVSEDDIVRALAREVQAHVVRARPQAVLVLGRLRSVPHVAPLSM